MNESRTRIYMLAIAAVALLTMACVPMDSDSSDADGGNSDIVIQYLDKDGISVTAGSSKTFEFFLTNTTASVQLVQIDVDTSKCERLDAEIASDLSSGKTIKLDSGKTATVTVTLTAGTLAHQDDYDVIINIAYIAAGAAEGTEATKISESVGIRIKSNLSAAGEYNKFLGLIPNGFDGALGETWFTGLVTFAGWLLIGYAVMLVVIPVTVRIISPNAGEDREAMRRLLRYLCHPIIVLNALGRLFRCVGASEDIIDMTNTVFYLSYTIIGIVVAWKLYLLIIHIVVKKMDDKADEIAGKDVDLSGLEPLLRYIGQIALAILAVFLILGLFGVDLTSIIVSAGVVSLGITMGAQSVLGQFFSGLVILSTRPFVKGDLITVGTDSTIFRVRKVNVMFTELENWDNTDVNMMPNNLITSNKVKNITRETLVYKVYLSADVAYGSNITLVRTIMQEVALANARVISDGSVTRPYTRVEAFGNSNITIKMGMYVDDFNASYSIAGQIREALYEEFLNNDIAVDYNDIIVHMGEPSVKKAPGARPSGPPR